MTQPRQPKGVPTGGQFSTNQHDEAATPLTERVDPQIAYRIDDRSFRQLLAGPTDHDDINELRREFAIHLRSHPATNWQQGWNAFIGRDQRVRLRSRRCRRCRGFGVDVRRGGMPCRECRGRGRASARYVQARTVELPSVPHIGEP